MRKGISVSNRMSDKTNAPWLFLWSVYLLAHCAIEASCNRFFFTKLLQSNTKKSQIFSLHFQTSFPTFRQIGPDCSSLLTEKQYKYRKIQAHKPSFCTSTPGLLFGHFFGTLESQKCRLFEFFPWVFDFFLEFLSFSLSFEFFPWVLSALSFFQNV